MRPLFVVNNFGQFNHLILRMLRDLGISAEMVPNTTPVHEVTNRCRGVILGGGPTLERAGNSPLYLEAGLPVLGICLGLHIIAEGFGGSVTQGKMGGYGAVQVEIADQDKILMGYPQTIRVWASHADEVACIPEGFTCLASSLVCDVEGIACSKDRVYGLQWHPEVSQSEDGRRVYENFDRITRE
ncbi:MAG: GMP synthase subunit A [Methanomicrobiales archaeon]|jgi:GMP synthase (glutamine-hydrolysing)|nr:GMP synthase subunit A [Methanomicrobiales archaeon]